MCEIDDPGHIHTLGSGMIRVPRGRAASVCIDPRKASSIAEEALVEVVGKFAFKLQQFICVHNLFLQIYTFNY